MSKSHSAKKQKAPPKPSDKLFAALTPENAAAKLLKLLKASRPEALDPGFLDQAAQTSEKLRAKGDYALALELCQAGKRATDRLCLEEALCALGLGKDEIAREIASSSARLEKPLGIVLDALENKPLPESIETESEGQKALWLTAQAVQRLEQDKSEAAIACLKQIEPGQKASFCTEAFQVLAELGRQEPDKNVVYDLLDVALDQSPIQEQPRLQSLLVRAIAHRIPQFFVDFSTEELEASPQALFEAMAIAYQSEGKILRPREFLSDVVFYGAFEGFARSEQPLAVLWTAFSQIDVEPGEADTLLDNAAELKAENAEVLRGRYILGYHHVDHQNAGFLKEGIAAAEKLVTLYESNPDALAFRAILLKDLALQYMVRRQPSLALAALRKAQHITQNTVLRTPEYRGSLAAAEAQLTVVTNPQKALALAEEGLKVLPQSAPLWTVKVNIIKALHGDKAADELLVEAARQRISDTLVQAGLRILHKKGQSALELGPGRPGLLLAELESALRKSASQSYETEEDQVAAAFSLLERPELKAYQQAMSREDQRAFLVGAIAVFSLTHSSQYAIDLTASLIKDQDWTEEDKVVFVAACINSEPDMTLDASWLKRLIEKDIGEPYLTRAAAMLVSFAPDALDEIVQMQKDRFSQETLSELEKLSREEASPLASYPNNAMKDTAKRLLPEVNLPLIWQEASTRQNVGFQEQNRTEAAEEDEDLITPGLDPETLASPKLLAGVKNWLIGCGMPAKKVFKITQAQAASVAEAMSRLGEDDMEAATSRLLQAFVQLGLEDKDLTRLVSRLSTQSVKDLAFLRNK